MSVKASIIEYNTDKRAASHHVTVIHNTYISLFHMTKDKLYKFYRDKMLRKNIRYSEVTPNV